MKRVYVKAARSSKNYEYSSKNFMKRFNKKQRDEIRKGLDSGLDVSWYADPKYGWSQMQEIREGLDSGLDVSLYADPKFSAGQMVQIRFGLESGIDVSVYADPKYTWWQMEEIREGLESRVDVSLYADPKYDGGQMYEIREGLESGLDASLYADPRYSRWQMREIREGLESEVDISWYADPKYTWRQMEEIREGLESEVDVSVYADPRYDSGQMYEIRESLKSDKSDKSPEVLNVQPTPTPGQNKYQRAKGRWNSVKDALNNRSPLDIVEIEEEFNLSPLEGRGAYTLGLTFEENSDGSVTFLDSDGEELKTVSSEKFDSMVAQAISRSSTRQSFAKAFATQLKRNLGL